MTGWEPDVLPGYWQQQLPLGADPDGEGELVATLVSRGRPQPRATRAVLVVHGYTDYFFHTALADHLAGRGFTVYAMDLPKCGRSRRAGQTPHFTSDLAHYDSALQAALTAVDAEQVLMYGHSAGGLILSLWLDRLRRRGDTGPITGLVLNSPFLDLHGPAVLRTPPTSAALMALARVRKMTVVRKPGVGGYGTTLHRDFAGEFDYNLDWKPVGGFPITFGWINAIRRGQKRLHRGLDIGVPSLILRSDHSVAEVSDPDLIQRGDAVLDVDQIARWAGCIGNRLTVVPITDAKHDVFLSLPEPRAAAYRELDTWLDWYLTSGTTSTAPDAG
ncbi:alpha/beta hydrolase [Mycolicibacterium neoaurum]|uniref:alpha/beta hydrolase n=1 Tax=Mycolicibacterium neoaurum TaxID=1795 RepID=UPI00248BE7E3|nr:alpha/beta hydrolase [Mycolicibacterium neoaurum]WBP96672.1 alpha/beta hydrolase [Mycolicibacterium neoaurum]WBS10358.1 alpha/beta hydrolase [Mycolicibacterium neoaurum]